MALPPSGPISFSDLNIEIGNSATAQLDLQTAASDLGTGGAPYSMDEFYVPLSSFLLVTTGYVTSTESCAGSTSTTTRYHNGAGALPTIGDTVYTNSSGTSTFNGSNLYWGTTGLGSSLRISSAGVITDDVLCGISP